MSGYRKGDKVIFTNKKLGGTKGTVVSQSGSGHELKIEVQIEGGDTETTSKNSIAAIGSEKHKKWLKNSAKGATRDTVDSKKRKRAEDDGDEDEDLDDPIVHAPRCLSEAKKYKDKGTQVQQRCVQCKKKTSYYCASCSDESNDLYVALCNGQRTCWITHHKNQLK